MAPTGNFVDSPCSLDLALRGDDRACWPREVQKFVPLRKPRGQEGGRESRWPPYLGRCGEHERQTRGIPKLDQERRAESGSCGALRSQIRADGEKERRGRKEGDGDGDVARCGKGFARHTKISKCRICSSTERVLCSLFGADRIHLVKSHIELIFAGRVGRCAQTFRR